MKLTTVTALKGLSEQIGQVASLLLPNCQSDLDRENVTLLREVAGELREALKYEKIDDANDY